MAEEEDPDIEKEDGEVEAEPNVFSMTGDPYEAPDEGLKTACPDTIKCVKDVLSHALANQIRGVYVLGWSPQHQRFVRWAMMPSNELQEAAAVRFLGGLELAKVDLIDLTLNEIIEIDEDGFPIE